MKNYIQPLHEGGFYHIYNQGNNGESIFFNKGNYEYFLKKLDFYLTDFLDIYCFCLLPNHFHLLISIKDWRLMEPKLKSFVGLEKISQKSDNKTEAIVSEQFRRFFMSYSKAINKQNGRTGSLFRKYFKRKLIDNDNYFQRTVVYIHRNPQNHGIFDDFKRYPWSSYSRILDDRHSKLKKAEVISYFDSKENFIFSHLSGSDDDLDALE